MGCNGESHELHICHLKSNGQEDRIESLTDNPTVQCRQCGARANSLEYVCAAHLKEDAPNVEGGHGSLGFAEIGKVHDGS